MGRTASSSKRKSSKRKSSKLSHEDRKRKKSRRNKSKKLHRRYDSDSSFSDDDSISLVSVSSPSSEDDYKSKKVHSRSRTRNDTKSGRKKFMKSSSSKDSKKRKRSKKDIDTKSSKKSRKIKRKRDVSISSLSSDSESIEESEPVRHRGRSRERKINKNKTRNSKSHSRSSSSCSRYSVNPVGEEIVMHESRRLKSVISVVEPSERDLYKEEIVYDRDDYPSSRSNDSYDGGSRRKSTYFSPVASEEEVNLYNLRETDPIEDATETEISSTVAGPGNDDLELLLRQKALENLRRFRGEREMKSKNTSGPNKEDCPATNVEKNSSPVLERDLTKEEIGTNNSGGGKTGKDTKDPGARQKALENLRSLRGEREMKSKNTSGPNKDCPATDVEKNSSPVLERDLTKEEIGTNNSSGGKDAKDPGASIDKDIHQFFSGISPKEKISTCSEVVTLQGLPDSNLLVTESTLSEMSPSLSPRSKSNQATGVGVGNICSEEPKDSCGDSTSLENSSKGIQDESKDGSSQFEKKTMSVMRGGEMVQVNYKVYIPKKVPALARRQLKR